MHVPHVIDLAICEKPCVTLIYRKQIKTRLLELNFNVYIYTK